MKVSKEFRVGIIIIAGIALSFWGINYLKGKDFFTSEKLIYAVYDRVDGLAPSNPVVVNGLKIGKVQKLTLLPDHSGRIVVSMHIGSGLKIPANSTAQIFSADLLGTKSVQLIMGNATEDIENGDTLFSAIQKSLSQEVNAQVGPIKEKAENILSSMDSVLAVFRNVFNEGTKENLRKSFESIANSLRSVENVTGNLDTVLSKQGKLREIFNNLASITANIKDNNEKITAMINNFSAISDTLARGNIAGTLENIKKTLDQASVIFQKINRGQGSLGQLATNDSLYHNLNESAEALDHLLRDFNANPKRYFGVSLISIGNGKKTTKKKTN
jgi:phospholipid/cholesterol/gamma-HCH transport system substrate-binding protein